MQLMLCTGRFRKRSDASPCSSRNRKPLPFIQNNGQLKSSWLIYIEFQNSCETHSPAQSQINTDKFHSLQLTPLLEQFGHKQAIAPSFFVDLWITVTCLIVGISGAGASLSLPQSLSLTGPHIVCIMLLISMQLLCSRVGKLTGSAKHSASLLSEGQGANFLAVAHIGHTRQTTNLHQRRVAAFTSEHTQR